MNYSVKQLKDNLGEKILRLGIDNKFKENPAFASSLAEIENLILQMNMLEEIQNVSVKEDEREIYFDWISTDGEKYSMTISSSSPNTFSCIMIEEKTPFVGTNGQSIRQKNVIEEVTTIDKSGFITMTTNGAMIDNFDCDDTKCNEYNWAEKKNYTANGVMSYSEYKSFPRGKLAVNFDNASVNSMLFVSRRAFNLGTWNDKYERRTLLRREKLDTARIICEDKANGIKYNATTYLNQEHGLRDMRLLGGDPYPQDVIIPPLSQEQIETMIKMENNPKVAEGLREYAVGRENYFYNSAEDLSFVSEGISQGISR